MTKIRNAIANALTWVADKIRPPVTTQGGGGHGEE
jgi:hypothetical protein